MATHDNLGIRMKDYEQRNQYYLQKRTPVIIRVDGKAFHTFTRNLKKPFDSIFVNAMIQTMEHMAIDMQNCIFAYQQSDEITFVLKDYSQLNTEAWFDYRTDKLCSISASMATYYFNMYFREKAEHYITAHPDGEYSDILRRTIISPAMFDARCFNIPREEVINLIYWRQLDAVRNSIQAAGQAKFSHKQLMGKSCKMIKEMLEENGTPWENLPTYLQRGTCAIREGKEWITDYSMPMLVKEGREYLEALI